MHINSISDDDAIIGSSLYQISLPSEFALKPYGRLMEYLTSKNILPLGLLREVVDSGEDGQESFMPFVFTNPDKDTELHPGDRVFCLSLQHEEVTETIEVKVKATIYMKILGTLATFVELSCRTGLKRSSVRPLQLRSSAEWWM